MWTEITRRRYERAVPRYASNLSDAEWALIEPFMPVRKLLGRPRETDLRAVLDAILYIARSGCQWRMLPKDFPPCTNAIPPPSRVRSLRPSSRPCSGQCGGDRPVRPINARPAPCIRSRCCSAPCASVSSASCAAKSRVRRAATAPASRQWRLNPRRVTARCRVPHRAFQSDRQSARLEQWAMLGIRNRRPHAQSRARGSRALRDDRR
jgi:transposase